MAVARRGQHHQDDHTPLGSQWAGIETQRSIVRERMKLLLAAQDSKIVPVEFRAEPGELLLRQGATAKRVLLLTKALSPSRCGRAMVNLKPWRSWKPKNC